MSRQWISVWVILLGLFLLLSQTVPVYAQEPTPENDDNCVVCHEHRYYLYDSGKYFCLCEAPMHCVYCHSGRTDSPKEEIAHEGLVLYPTRNHAERCQTCHTEDYFSRVVTFETVAGVSSTPLPIITATPMELVQSPVQSRSSLNLFTQFELWQQIGLGMVGVAMIITLILGIRCWKTDCRAKAQF